MWIISELKLNTLLSTCQQIWKIQQWSQDWRRSAFIPIQKKGNAKECSNHHTIALISRASNSKVMLKILQAKLLQYMNWELPDVQAGFRKGRGTRDQIANIRWIIEKARNSRKASTSASQTKAFTVWITTIKSSSRHANTRPPYMSPEKPIWKSRSNRTRDGTMDWSKLGKECVKAVCCHSAYLTYMQSTSWEMLGCIPSWNRDCQEKYQPPQNMQMIPL